MDAITIREDLLESLERDAERMDKTVADLVNEVLENYLYEQEQQRQEKKIERETEAFVRMHDDLKQKYFGQWVAFHDGQLVDHDTDELALYKRIRSTYGNTAVLMREVEEDPERILWWRSFRLERIDTP